MRKPKPKVSLLDPIRMGSLANGMAVVVNIRTEEYDLYIGRANSRRRLPASAFGNPFTWDDCDDKTEGDTPVQRYKKWFAVRYNSDEDFRASVDKLKGLRLGCWCHPEKCHGDVLGTFVNASDPEREQSLKEWTALPFPLIQPTPKAKAEPQNETDILVGVIVGSKP